MFCFCFCYFLGLFLSFGFVLAIMMVVKVVGKKGDKKETIVDAIFAAIDRSCLRIEQL